MPNVDFVLLLLLFFFGSASQRGVMIKSPSAHFVFFCFFFPALHIHTSCDLNVGDHRKQQQQKQQQHTHTSVSLVPPGDLWSEDQPPGPGDPETRGSLEGDGWTSGGGFEPRAAVLAAVSQPPPPHPRLHTHRSQNGGAGGEGAPPGVLGSPERYSLPP